MLLLSGFSTGYVQAVPHAAAVEMYSVQQDNTCTGVVVDQNGETVIGASVVVKGTTNGTITGLDGDFSIPNVKKGDVIVVSYVGYVDSEIVWEGKPLKIALKEDSKTLDEVVVVGYATVKKANLTGAVSAVDDKVLADRPIVNLGQGLQGTIPNLNITTSGQPGKGSSFNVRGETSINGGSPLVLVDGVQMDPNLINPQDVASVSVLKDAASASIYGASCRLWRYPYHNQEWSQEYAYTSVIRCICFIQQPDNPSGIHELYGICALDERCKQYYQRS